MRYFFTLILISLCNLISNAQYIHFMSDHFQGGVTGGGYNPGNVDLTGRIDLHICKQ